MPEQTQAQLTNEELEKAVVDGSARVIYDRNGFRIVIHGGLKYHCGQVRFALYARAAGNRVSDYRGTKSEWQIRKVEPDTRYQRTSKPRPSLSADELVSKLKLALVVVVDGRWLQKDWPLVSPANVRILIDEIERQHLAKAA
jgi:hypothetical protein